MVHPRICIMVVSRISKNKTQTCPKQHAVIHAKVILEVDFFKKGNQSSWKNKKSRQLYAFIYEYSSLRCYPFKNLVYAFKGNTIIKKTAKMDCKHLPGFSTFLVPAVPHTHSSVRYLV